MLNILRAIEIATKAHAFSPNAARRRCGFQSRKLRDMPYLLHPLRVAQKVENHLATCDSAAAGFISLRETMLIVSVLHDVEEDTDYPMDEIEKEFGKDVREGVRWLTSRSKQKGVLASDGTPLANKNRAERKLADLKCLQSAPAHWQVVKMFDRIDNLYDFVGFSADFILNLYIPESYNLHDAIGHADQAVAEQLMSAIQWLEAITKGQHHEPRGDRDARHH